MPQVLYIMTRVLDFSLFQPVHWFVRQCYLQLVPPILSGALGVRAIARHGTKEGTHFHLTLSDLDIAVCVPLDFDRARARAIIHRYKKLKRFLIFLGELEFYYEHEWVEKVRLETEYAALIWFIRDYRKVRWMEAEQGKYQDRYHKLKATRSIDRILNKWGNFSEKLRAVVGEQVFSYLTTLPSFPPREISFFNRVFNSNDQSNELCWFCHFVAPKDRGGSESSDLYELRKIRRLILSHELLCYRAFLRVKDEDLGASDAWVVGLNNELGRSGTIPSKKATMLWSQSAFLDIGNFCWPFELVIDETERYRCHKSGTVLPAKGFQNALTEELALYFAESIRVDDSDQRDWLITLHPDLEGKISGRSGRGFYDWEINLDALANGIDKLKEFNSLIKTAGWPDHGPELSKC